MAVYAFRLVSCVNNFAVETAEINSEIKHLLKIYQKINVLSCLI